ncbi:hypothetical protein [Nocardia neocaledoniensis]|nr:hypothetical protein [Nocardia neocaledoniensis]
MILLAGGDHRSYPIEILTNQSIEPESSKSSMSSDQALELAARQRGAEDRRYLPAVDLVGHGTVDFRVKYTADVDVSGVAIRLWLPDQLQLEHSNFGILNSNNPGGAVLSEASVSESLQEVQVEIGSYVAGSDALVVFPVNLRRPQELPCGTSVYMVRASVGRATTTDHFSNVVRLSYHRDGPGC